jgi:hypothetical protein
MALIGADRIGAISNRFVLPPRSSNFLSYRGYDG